MKSKSQLSHKERFGYSAGILISSIPSAAISTYFLYHMTQIMMIPPSIIIPLFIGTKITSAVIAPVIGFYSDRLDTKWGRKRPWFLFGSMPLAVTFFLLFVHLDFSGETAATIWAASILLMFNIFIVCVEIPYKALLPSLTKDYHERTLLYFYQIPFSIVEVLLVFTYLYLVLQHGSDYFAKADSNNSIIYLGGILSVSLMIVIPAFISFKTTKEPLYKEWGERKNFISTLKSLKENKPFLNLIIGYFLVSGGYAIFALLLPYYVKVLSDLQPLTEYANYVFFGTSLLGMIAWYFISKKIGKRNACIAGISIFGVSLILFYFADMLSIYGIYGFMFIIGFGYSSVLILTFSMLPDTMEYDFTLSGIRRDGICYGIWSLLVVANYYLINNPSGVLVKSVRYSLTNIKLVMGLISALLAFSGLYFFYRYSLTKEKYEEVLAKIESRSIEGSSNSISQVQVTE